MDTEDAALGLMDVADPEYEDDIEIGAERKTIIVIVFAPKELEPKKFRFKLDETVGDAAKVAAEAFEYQVGSPTFQTKDGTALARELTLKAAGVVNREELELVDAGGGV